MSRQAEKEAKEVKSDSKASSSFKSKPKAKKSKPKVDVDSEDEDETATPPPATSDVDLDPDAEFKANAVSGSDEEEEQPKPSKSKSKSKSKKRKAIVDEDEDEEMSANEQKTEKKPSRKQGGVQIPEFWPWEEAKKVFEKPDVIPAEDVELEWKAPDVDGLVQFLVVEKGFKYVFLEFSLLFTLPSHVFIS